MRSTMLIAIATLVLGAALFWAVEGSESGLRFGASPAIVVRTSLAPLFDEAERSASDHGTPRRREDRIELPFGSSVSWVARVPRGGSFGVSRLEQPAAASLEVEADDIATLSTPLEGCAAGCRVSLAEFEGSPVRLTVRADDAGVVLSRPALYGEALPEAPAAKLTQDRPPIVLYVVDTLRADRLGAYGDGRGLTPRIDAFADGATVFEKASAQATWTKPAIASILTGLLPMEHRVTSPPSILPRESRVLAEFLRKAGYRTGAAVTNTLVDRDFGFGQGFDHFVTAGEMGAGWIEEGRRRPVDSDLVNAAAQRWLDGLPAGYPFLLYLHMLDPHAPHSPPEPYRSRIVSEPDRDAFAMAGSLRWVNEAFENGEFPEREQVLLETLYDAEVAHNDARFGELLDDLKTRGLYDDALIVFVSDHGEGFFEHGFRGHTKPHYYQELLHIPLIVKAPRQARARRVRSLAQHIDLLPTMLDYASVPVPEALRGTSLRAEIEGTGSNTDRLVASGNRNTGALRDGRYKLLSRGKNSGPPLFDLDTDPLERTDVSDAHPIRVAFMIEEMARIDTESRASGTHIDRRALKLTAEKLEELRALGYLE